MRLGVHCWQRPNVTTYVPALDDEAPARSAEPGWAHGPISRSDGLRMMAR